MKKSKLKFTVFGIIRRPVSQVFDAVYNPAKLKKYFTTKTASGPLIQGTTVTWDFHDFPGAFPVHVKKTVKNKLIVVEWGSATGGLNPVEFKFKSRGPRATKVEITEQGWKDTPKGLANSYLNCFGWAQMLCCMKTYLEHGINLRKDFFK